MYTFCRESCELSIYGKYITIHLQNRELKDPELITRQRALRTLCDYLHDPEHIAEALNVGKNLAQPSSDQR